MNLKLRTLVLEKSLKIEAKLSEILMILLDIKESENKTLGYKGSALSLKSKVDLLFDINKIKKDVYVKLIMFMEIRNQFIHNIDSYTFEIVLARTSKEKKLVDLYDKFVVKRNLVEPEIIAVEEKLKQGFEMLTIEINEELDVAKKGILDYKLEVTKSKLKLQEAIMHERALEAISEAIDESTAIFGKRWRETFNEERDIDLLLRTLIQGLFSKKMQELYKIQNKD